MTPRELILWCLASVLVFACASVLVRWGVPWLLGRLARLEAYLEQVLNHELLLDVQPRLAMALGAVAMLTCGMAAQIIGGSWVWFAVGVAASTVGPHLVLRALAARRRSQLERQLADGIMTLASGVRAGLNLVQAMRLIVDNHTGPIQQEFAQLLREYNMGLDLNQAMRNAANRVGLQNYRLLFTALEMHRLRGGDAAQSLDRIGEAVREIQRLEGKLDALTAQSRAQARMMAAMALLVLLIWYAIAPESVKQLFVEPAGRVLLLTAAVLTIVGFLWIRRIMAVDI